ncbi:MAG: MqnA/MqnD/SBP family protein, partial [Desulfonatronovibrio sp.]
MKKSLLAAISPCPNDTYIFGAWVLGMVGDLPGIRTRFVWEDVQTLNEMAESGGADIIKVSAVQALKLDDYEMLTCGGAFGLGDGPKLVARAGLNGTPEKIAVPGTLTTAYALLGAAADFDFEPVPMFFHEIPDAISKGLVDAGLLIHETALVYKEMGFKMILDLGQWWKVRSDDLPLPLGVIVMRKV